MKRLEYEVSRALTADELTAVLDGIKAAELPGVALARAFVVIDILLADVGLTPTGLRQAGLPIDGRKLSIPQAQWHAIGQALVDAGDRLQVGVSDVDRVNLLLDWMNRGPSGTAEDTDGGST